MKPRTMEPYAWKIDDIRRRVDLERLEGHA